MKDYKQALEFINEKLYEPLNYEISELQAEDQNKEYGACTFKLNNKKIRFRTAKQTPNKQGQFVVFWEKDNDNKNTPYKFDKSPELIIITCIHNQEHFGQFIFPKEVLLKQGILKSNNTKGKMGIRVYPIWDQDLNKQASKSQAWQLEYFVDIKINEKLNTKRINSLYQMIK